MASDHCPVPEASRAVKLDAGVVVDPQLFGALQGQGVHEPDPFRVLRPQGHDQRCGCIAQHLESSG